MSQEEEQLDLAVLGAGAAGMMGAIAAAQKALGKRIGIFERNVQPGIKVLVCGGGRCNFTNDGPVDFLIAQFGRNGRFLTPPLQHLDNAGLREFFAGLGVPSHVEPGGKVYPNSNQARSVVDALVRRMRELGVEVFAGAGSAMAEISVDAHGAFLLKTADGRAFRAGIVLLAVGGMSYQRMGTLGDGYRFAEALGHTVVKPRPAIVGLITREEWPKALPGLAVRDVEVTVPGKKGKVASVGDMLFTHFGLSGPAILNPSEIVAEMLEGAETVAVAVDFARHVTHEAAHGLFRQWQQTQGKKLLRKVLSQNVTEIVIHSTSPDQTGAEGGDAERRGVMLPARLAEKILELEQIPLEQTCATLNARQIHRLVGRIKQCPFAITATRGFKEAMVTAGGVKLSEVNPRTMESRIVPNLFLSGEVLNLTGPSGGYNLQLAFSTGHLAGSVIGERLAGVSGL